MSVNIVEGLAAAFQTLTGLETISLGSKMMINNSGTWASVGTDTVWQIVKNSGAKIVGSTAYPVNNGVLGSFSGLQYEAVFDVGGAQLKNCLATPSQLSNGMRAALQNGGARIGNTALKPVTDLVVQSTGTGQQVAVTTKGVLAKVAFETALVGAAAALGVTVGIGIVEENPQLVTKIYNRLAGTDIDPDLIADIAKNTTVWENIRDGTCYLAEDFINAVKGVFVEEGVYDPGTQPPILPEVETSITYEKEEPTPTEWGLTNNVCVSYPYENTRSETFSRQITMLSTPKACIAVGTRRFVSGGDNKISVIANLVSRNSFSLEYETNMGRYIYQSTQLGKTPGDIQLYYRSVGGAEGLANKEFAFSLNSGNIPVISFVYYETGSDFTSRLLAAVSSYFDSDDDSGLYPLPEGGVIPVGLELKDGATYPSGGQTLAEDYPEWDANSVETISDWNDETSTPNKRKWYPINGKADQSTGQDEAQDGSVSEDDMSDVVNDIDKSLEENSDVSQDVETQPDIYPNPNPAPGTDLYPVTPNPPDIDASDGEDPDPTIPILTTVATSGLAHIYNPTLAEVKDLGAVLWTPSLIENIKKIFVNPMDGIIGFHILYATPKTIDPEEIVLGYYGTGVNSKVVSNQYIEVDCGYIAVDEWWNDARDYEPYVNVSLYLPFIGIVPLKANDVIGSHVKVKYHVDVLTGTCLAMVEVQKYNARGTLYQFVGNCAVTIPLSSGNYTAVITSLLSVASSAVGGAAIGGAGGALFGAFKGAAINASRAKLQVIQSGNLGANAGAMGIRKPFLIVRRPMTKDAYGYNMQYGYPAFKWVTLGQVKGFTRVKSVLLNDVKCTDEEKDMIEAALKEGVIL